MEAVAIHSLNVYVTYTTVRHAFYFFSVVFYPAVVQQAVDSTQTFDGFVETFLCSGVVYGEAYLFAYLAFKQREVVFALADRSTVYLLNDAAGFYVGLLQAKRTLGNDFLNLQAVAFVRVVEEYAQVSSSRCGAVVVISTSGVRCVKLAQHFAKHFGKVVLVADVRQEAFVVLLHAFPVGSVKVGLVEFIFHLTPCVVEDVSSFFHRTEVELCLEIDICSLSVFKRNLLQRIAAQVEVFSLLVGIHK